MKVERRKLFSASSPQPKRRKLFSTPTEGGVDMESKKTVICHDCGYTFDTLEGISHLACPKCGGKRFDVVPGSFVVGPEVISEKTYSRRSLFGDSEQKEFSEPSSDFEVALKANSGQTIPFGNVEKLFSVTAGEMVEKGFADWTSQEGGDIKVHSSAFLQSKLFSKLIISVTKILDLDPQVMLEDQRKEDIISALGNSESLEPKSIMLIRKAHSLPKEVEFSEEEEASWLRDSGICNDLRLEFGGSIKKLPEFNDILAERYPDAPENITEILAKKGVIVIQGDQVDILK